MSRANPTSEYQRCRKWIPNSRDFRVRSEPAGISGAGYSPPNCKKQSLLFAKTTPFCSCFVLVNHISNTRSKLSFRAKGFGLRLERETHKKRPFQAIKGK